LDPEPYSLSQILNLDVTVYQIGIGETVAILVMIILLVMSAQVSGSEVAYFSLKPADLNDLQGKKTKASSTATKLLEIPERLLATILISNNLINIGIVIVSSYIMGSLFDFSNSPHLGFVIQIVVVTFLLLVFGEILPKLYANHSPLRFSVFMAPVLYALEKAFWGMRLSWLLITSSSMVNGLSIKSKNISMNDLGEALELTSNDFSDEKNILEGIVKFGNIEVREIMRSRVDVIAAEIKTPFRELLNKIIDSGYSRIPVYEETFDNIKGILYIKDLLPHLNKTDTFIWQSLIRPPYFVPETKKINSLLKDFQTKKIHLAVVIDEYGGSSGIVTLEDVLEEIVGEITDESDEDEVFHKRLDDFNYVFEAKILLNDFCKILDIEDTIFDDVRGEAETLAGLILELTGDIPDLNQKIKYKYFTFTIISVDNRRIRQVHVQIDKHKQHLAH
jgi:gliding motility-associated protein GldE